MPPDAGLELQVELHPRSCICRGGSWLYSASAKMVARCSSASPEKESLAFSAWKALGKPACLEVYRETLARRS